MAPYPCLASGSFICCGSLDFYVHVARDVAPFYPPRFDQLPFYLATYDLIGAVYAKGLSALLDELLWPRPESLARDGGSPPYDD
jgi:hypothetical protein